MLYCLSLLCLSLVGLSAGQEGPRVQTSQGWLQGAYTTTRGGRKVLQFLGVPYAEKPVNELRFKSPVAATAWDGVRSATQECSMCLQQMFLLEQLKYKVQGSEDCLCINIFTPNASTEAKLPVLFWIHGAAYVGLSSSTEYYSPEKLLDKDVVLVTFNYRLGVLSYLSTEDEVIPGNFGNKDQAFALQWVRDNIASFGGDPASITLMGESSGAASVHLHMLSPLSHKLFQRAIVHSGSGVELWAVSPPGLVKRRSATVAALVGCPATPSEALLTCLQATPAETIVNTTHRLIVWEADPVVFWNPVIEKSSVKDAFLTKNPRKVSSNKPLLIGFNYGEGGMKLLSLLSRDGDIDRKFNEWNARFDYLTPIALLYNETAPDPAAVTKAVRKFYLGDAKEVTTTMTSQLNQMFGDFWFINGVMDAVEKHRGPKYLFHFNYNTTASVCQDLFNTTVYVGACHLDELMYLFPMNMELASLNDPQQADYKLSEKMVEIWTNFAKSSVPSGGEVNWERVNSSSLEHLYITNEGISMKEYPIKERRTFWKTLALRKAENEDIEEIYE